MLGQEPPENPPHLEVTWQSEEVRQASEEVRPAKATGEARQASKEAHTASGEGAAARRLQAWWRGTLVRRTLLAAALHAWVLQAWWRGLLGRRAAGLRRALLQIYVLEERAAVRLQALLRMWQCHRDYCRVRRSACLSWDPADRFRLQIREARQARQAWQGRQGRQAWQDPRARRLGAAKDLEFRVEILTV